MELGEWIRAARKSRGWTGDQLAERLNTTKANVSHWETGKHEPSFAQVLLIRDLTGYALHDVGPPAEWPLPQVPREWLTSLTPGQLAAVQAGIVAALTAVTHSPAPRKRRASGE